MTGNDLIAKALRLINVLASGETPTAAEANDGLVTTNFLLDSWSADRLQVFQVQRGQEFALISGQQGYTVGAGGFVNIARPAVIQRVGIINLGNPAQPLELPLEYLNVDEWASIPVKSIQSALPLKVWDDKGFPLRTLNYWPIPNASVRSVLYTWQPLSSFPDLVTDIQFPTGYFKAILYNLAVDLAPEYGAVVPPEVSLNAVQALAEIKALNQETPLLRCDDAVLDPRSEVYNWLTDGAGRYFRG